MRALVLLGVAIAAATACGGDDGPSSAEPDLGECGGQTDSYGGAWAGQTTSAAAPAVAGGAGGGGGAAGAGGARDDVAGAAGEAGAAAATLTVGIVPAATHFLAYGKLRIGFERAVDAATLTLTLTPRLPERLAVTSVTQVDATTIDATLAYYHLPLDYQLSVTGLLPDATRFQAMAGLSGQDNGARAAFLSKQTGTGDFKSWTDAPAQATPLQAADAVCQREADAAGLRGTFQAFVSLAGGVDAGCRALGFGGLLADNCGQAALPVDHTPILSLNGTPIVAGGTGILADNWAIPISFYADGSPAVPDYTWSGTIAGGKGFANDDCDHWTATASAGIAALQAAKHVLDYGFGRACTSVGDLICLQTVGTAFGPSTLHEVGGKRAFISKGHLYGTMSFGGKAGVAAADALCQSEALTATLANANKFRAYLGTADTDALCYILGQTGKVADHCGLAALPTTEPWRRVDNYPIGTAAELQAGALQAPLALAADATRLLDERPRTGTELNGATSWNCGDWASSGFYSLSGNPSYITGDWTSHWTTDCDGEETSVYCFEN